MNVSIITEGGFKIGLGHISRSISLYQAFIEKNIIPHLYVYGEKSLKPILEGKDYCFIDWIKEKEKIYTEIKNSDITIIDSYLADKSIYQKISQIAKIPVFIDDNMRINYPKGIVINSAINAPEMPYPKKRGIKYLLGTKFSMLNKEFWDSSEKIIREKIEVIMLTLGGSDVAGLTPKILKILQDNFPYMEKKVIIGRNFHNVAEIENLKDERSELIYFPNSGGMKAIMLEADVAITAGGQTVYELASMGVPAIIITVAENQIPHVMACDKLGLNFYSGWWQNKETFNNIKIFLNKLKDIEVRKKLIKLFPEYVKSDGSRDIIDFLIKILEDKQNL